MISTIWFASSFACFLLVLVSDDIIMGVSFVVCVSAVDMFNTVQCCFMLSTFVQGSVDADVIFLTKKPFTKFVHGCASKQLLNDSLFFFVGREIAFSGAPGLVVIKCFFFLLVEEVKIKPGCSEIWFLFAAFLQIS